MADKKGRQRVVARVVSSTSLPRPVLHLAWLRFSPRLFIDVDETKMPPPPRHHRRYVSYESAELLTANRYA